MSSVWVFAHRDSLGKEIFPRRLPNNAEWLTDWPRGAPVDRRFYLAKFSRATSDNDQVSALSHNGRTHFQFTQFHGYSLMTKIQWRLAEPRDEAALRELHAEMERRLGAKLDLPNLFEEPVVACIVGETNGIVTHGVFGEAEVEICAIGVNPLAPREALEAETYLLSLLDRFRIRMVRAFVPTPFLKRRKRGRKAPVERLLVAMGFRREQTRFVTQFYRWIRPPQDGTPRAAKGDS